LKESQGLPAVKTQSPDKLHWMLVRAFDIRPDEIIVRKPVWF